MIQKAAQEIKAAVEGEVKAAGSSLEAAGPKASSNLLRPPIDKMESAIQHPSLFKEQSYKHKRSNEIKLFSKFWWLFTFSLQRPFLFVFQAKTYCENQIKQTNHVAQNELLLRPFLTSYLRLSKPTLLTVAILVQL